MPGLPPRDMNGYGDYDTGPMRGSQMANGYDPYNRDSREEYFYSREDPYRRDDADPYKKYDRREDVDPYRKVERNGRAFNDRFNIPEDQNSLPDFRGTEPSFELDHLATFAASTRYGYIHAEDGLRKLRQMENTTGIWTMRCILTVDRKQVTIIDNSTGEEIERFPIQLIHEPTAIFKNDKREIYNNIILFTVVEDPKKKNSQADMHIFQSVKCRAQDIVDELLAAKSGQPRPSSSSHRIPPPPSLPAPNPPIRDSMYNFNDMRETVETRHTQQYGANRASMIARPPFLSDRGDFEAGQNELLERDVQLLNHCFDDIEKFVARLQQAAESYKELEKRRKERGNKSKKKHSDGMLSARAKPPPGSDFVDIFQKFKLGFNLLAKLKAHIHDPNAPELVHFLFTPLSLIYEASRDPVHGNQNLAEQAVTPLINNDAKQLLLNCLTSKELELWQALGRHWTVTREENDGHVPVYLPRFYDGWQPTASVIDDGPQVSLETAVLHHSTQIRNREQEPEPRVVITKSSQHIPTDQDDFRYGRTSDEFIRSSQFDVRPSPQPIVPPIQLGNSTRAPAYNDYETSYERNLGRSSKRVDPPSVPVPVPTQPRSRAEENNAYYQELKRMGVQICEVQHDRPGKNSKELSVVKGDTLHVVDSSRNWWKVRNYKGEIGHCPYTILRELDKGSTGGDDSPRDRPTNGDFGSFGMENRPPPPPPVPDTGGNRRGAKRGDDLPDIYTHNIAGPALPSRPPPAVARSSPRSSPRLPHQLSPRSPPKTSPRHLQSTNMENQPIKMTKTSNPYSYENQPPSAFRKNYVIKIACSSPDSDSLKRPTPIRASRVLSEEKQQYQRNRSIYRKESLMKSKDPREKTKQDDLHDELRSKMAHGGPTKVPHLPVYITEHATPEEVQEWLQTKNLPLFCIQTFEGYSGHDMFHLVRRELERLVGRELAAKLESHLTVQKNMCGFGTVGGSELRAILQRRKEHADYTSNEEANMGQPPNFRPITPQQTFDSSYDSDDSTDQLADTGKTLRDLLIRQRKRIMGNNVFDSPDYDQ